MVGERTHRRHGAGRRSARAEEGHRRAVVRLRPRRRPRIRAAGQSRIRRRRPHPAARRRRAAAGGSGSAGGEGDSEDEFVFSLSREEFMQIFFDDLELPHLARTEIGRSRAEEERPRRLHQGGRAGESRRDPHADASRSRGASRWAAASTREAEAIEAAFALAVAAGRRRASRGALRRARAAASAAAAALPFLDELDLRYRNRVLRAGAGRARGDVLPDGRLGVDGRGQEGPRQALLHAALPLPDAQVRRGRPRLHPPHRRRRGGRRGHVLPRHALRRHGRLLGARARGQDPRRALRAAAGTSTRRRRPTATRSAPTRRGARASCASSCCRRRATTRTSSSPRRTRRTARRRCGPSTSASPEASGNFAMRRATRARGDLSGVPRTVQQGGAMSAANVISRGADWDFELLERYDTAIAAVAAEYRPRHLSEPDRDHHVRADARRLRVERAADRLSALVVRQGIHPQRAGLPARHAGPRLRDRDQLQSVHRVPDGGEHDDDAGAGDRARVLRPQLVLQGQSPVPAVDGRRRHPRLPGLRARAT